ncbi:MAG: hypothetical protein WD114_04220, partial [Phycisphaerales bacterium]
APLGRVDAPDDLLDAERSGVSRAFRPSLDPRRQVTHYIKIAHPRSYRLAVSLPEAPDGFADASLGHWLPRLQALADAEESLTICLLNRFVHGADGRSQWPRGIHAIRQAGLTEQDVTAFAMEAEGYFGCLDIFGLAARSAGVPGIYVALEGRGPGGRPRLLTREDPQAPELSAALLSWWRAAEKDGLAQFMQPKRIVAPEDGPVSGSKADLQLSERFRGWGGPADALRADALRADALRDGRATAAGGEAAASGMPAVGRGPR